MLWRALGENPWNSARTLGGNQAEIRPSQDHPPGGQPRSPASTGSFGVSNPVGIASGIPCPKRDANHLLPSGVPVEFQAVMEKGCGRPEVPKPWKAFTQNLRLSGCYESQVEQMDPAVLTKNSDGAT